MEESSRVLLFPSKSHTVVEQPLLSLILRLCHVEQHRLRNEVTIEASISLVKRVRMVPSSQVRQIDAGPHRASAEDRMANIELSCENNPSPLWLWSVPFQEMMCQALVSKHLRGDVKDEEGWLLVVSLEPKSRKTQAFRGPVSTVWRWHWYRGGDKRGPDSVPVLAFWTQLPAWSCSIRGGGGEQLPGVCKEDLKLTFVRDLTNIPLWSRLSVGAVSHSFTYCSDAPFFRESQDSKLGLSGGSFPISSTSVCSRLTVLTVSHKILWIIKWPLYKMILKISRN